MKIRSYQIIMAPGRATLEMRVVDKIRNGWQPLGSPFIDKNGYFNQAVVRYEETEVTHT